MRNRIALLLLLAFALSACSKNEQKQLSTQEQSAIISTLDSMYAHHIEKQQSDSLVNTYLSDAIVLTPGENEIKGINAIKDWYANAFGYGLKTITFSATSVMGDEQHLIETGQSTVGLLMVDTDTLSYEYYKYMHVWVKQANGKYKLSRDMWNQDQAKL